MDKYAVVIPAKNEASSIASVITDINSCPIPLDIVVVDDASTDDTATIAKKLNVIVLNHIESLGAWQATQTGFLWTLRNGYSHVVSMDADGQHLGSELALLFAEIERDNSIDLVIGACELRASLLKKLAWKTFKTITGIKTSDITSGFRLYSKRALQVLTSQRATLLEYQDVGVLVMLKQVGLRVSEVAVKMDKRFDGKSRIFSSWPRIIYYIFTTTLLSFSKALPDKNLRKSITPKD